MSAILWISEAHQSSSLTLSLRCQTRAGGSHTGSEMSRTYFSLFLRQRNQGKSQGLHIKGGVRSRNRLLKAKGTTVGHRAQQPPHGNSSDVPGLKHRQACGKTIRGPSLPPNCNPISPNRKAQHQRDKDTSWGGEAGVHGKATVPATLLLPQINTYTVMCKTNKKHTKNRNFQKASFGWSRQSFVQAREAPVNDKATEKHCRPGPGTT